MKRLLITLVITSFTLGLIGFAVGCRKTNNNTPKEDLAQYAVYTMEFSENNSDRGIAVIYLLQKGNTLTIDNAIYRFTEKDETKMAAISADFFQRATFAKGDSIYKKCKSLEEYATAFFTKQNNFKSSGKLTNSQLKDMIESRAFSLVKNEPSKSEHIFKLILNSISTTAYAQSSSATATMAGFFGVLAGFVGSGTVTDASIPLTAVFSASGTGVSAAFSQASGTSINTTKLLINTGSSFAVNTASTLAGTGPVAGLGFSLYFGINQVSKTMQDLWVSKVEEALSGYSSPANTSSTAYSDLWTDLTNNLNQYIRDLQTLNTLSVKTGGNTVDKTSATVSGENISGSSNPNEFIRGIAYSTSPDVNYWDNTTIAKANGVGNFSISLSGLEPNTTYYYRAFTGFMMNWPETYFSLADLGEIKSFKTEQGEYKIGDAALGGIVAYILQSGDAGYNPNKQHGLIAASTDQNYGTLWGCENSFVGTSTAFGTGAANTILISSICGYSPAKICDVLTLGGYDDWYLPSKDELNKLYLNRLLIGSFAADIYWTSSEVEAQGAHVQSFMTGIQANYSKAYPYAYVRAVRSF